MEGQHHTAALNILSVCIANYMHYALSFYEASCRGLCYAASTKPLLSLRQMAPSPLLRPRLRRLLAPLTSLPLPPPSYSSFFSSSSDEQQQKQPAAPPRLPSLPPDCSPARFRKLMAAQLDPLLAMDIIVEGQHHTAALYVLSVYITTGWPTRPTVAGSRREENRDPMGCISSKLAAADLRHERKLLCGVGVGVGAGGGAVIVVVAGAGDTPNHIVSLTSNTYGVLKLARDDASEEGGSYREYCCRIPPPHFVHGFPMKAPPLEEPEVINAWEVHIRATIFRQCIVGNVAKQQNTFSITCSSSSITPLKMTISDNNRMEDISGDAISAQYLYSKTKKIKVEKEDVEI
ncbi:hypothetical protein Taro_003376 [Colocasia esculenta]|uniref:Uncharacterized protein n=1 Tax=Colocasia esculenta TaxID=4460 RepID=A0A843TFB1_COLES|nr:hypothetical protein [Colocasia esculenta]